MMVIPIVIGVLGTVTKGLVQGLEDLEIRGRVEIIQTTALFRLARMLRKSPGDLQSLRLQWIGLVWLVGFYGISTFIGYLMPNPFLCK